MNRENILSLRKQYFGDRFYYPQYKPILNQLRKAYAKELGVPASEIKGIVVIDSAIDTNVCIFYKTIKLCSIPYHRSAICHYFIENLVEEIDNKEKINIIDEVKQIVKQKNNDGPWKIMEIDEYEIFQNR